MAAELFLLPYRPALDANAIPIPGAALYFYATGTSTPQAVYADDALTVTLGYIVEADAAGAWPSIYLDKSKIYRVVMRDAEGAPVPGAEADPYIPGVVDSLAGEIAIDAANAIAAADRAEGAALAAEGANNYRTTISQALIDFPVGTAFVSPEVTAENPNGEDRRYIRTLAAPGYALTADQPVSKKALLAPTGGAIVGLLDGGSVQDFADSVKIRASLTGVGDESAKLQAVIDGSAFVGKRIIEIGEGTFYVKDVLVPANVKIVGRGMYRTFLLRAGTLTTAVLQFAPGAGNITICDLTVDGTSAADAKSLISIGAHGSNIKFQRVRFQNACQRWALRGDPIAAFDGLEITDCEFINCPIGGPIIISNSLAVRGSRNIKINSNLWRQCGGNLCGLRPAVDSFAENAFDWFIDVEYNRNKVEQCTNTGSDGPIPNEFWGCTNFDTSYNVVDSGTRGLVAGASNRNQTVSFNMIKNQSLYAFECVGVGRNINVFNNVIENCATFFKDTGTGGSGLPLDNLWIHHNTVIGSGQSVFDNSRDCVSLGGGRSHPVTNARIEDNTFINYEYARSVVRLDGTDVYPTITFTGGGSGATATMTLRGVRGRVIDLGSGYASAPAVTCMSRDGNGSGMLATATIGSDGKLASVTITNGGTGYTLPAQLVLTGGGGVGGAVEALMGIEEIVLIGGTGYADGTFTISGNGATGNASGTFTQVGGVPTAYAITVRGEGFGRASSFSFERNTYEGRTYASTVQFATRTGGRLKSKNNSSIRTAYLDSAHYQGSGSVAYSYYGDRVPQGNPEVVSEGDSAEMRGAIVSGAYYAMGIVEAPTARYGCKIKGLRLAGNFSGNSLQFNDSSGSTLLEGIDWRDLTPTAGGPLGTNAALLVGDASGVYHMKGGAYVNLGAAKRGGRRLRVHYEGASGTRVIKLRHDRTAGEQTQAIVHCDWMSTSGNGAPAGNRTTVVYGNVSNPAVAPLVFSGAGTALSASASVVDGSGRMETTLTLPAGNNSWVVAIDAEINGLGTTKSFADFSVQVG